MAGKSKFQISKSLDERISKLVGCADECEPEFAKLESAFILGFNYTNATNYIGLTTDFTSHNASCPVVGLAYFKSLPTEQQIQLDLQPAREYFQSPETGLGSHAKTDKNEHMFLVYYKDIETNKAAYRVFDASSGAFLPEQPKVVLLDDGKIYQHSALVKLDLCLKLDILDSDGGKLQSKEKIEETLESIKKTLAGEANELKVHLSKSSFSAANPLKVSQTLETLYSHLDIPSDVDQMGDYLPQMTKEEKKKLHDRWRNKVKDQRAPLTFQLELGELSAAPDDKLPAQYYKLNLNQDFIYLSVNDTIAKGARVIMFHLRQKLELIKQFLVARAGTTIEPDEIKSCVFRPPSQVANHLVPAAYLIPCDGQPNYEKLQLARQQLHLTYVMPSDRPVARYSQRIMNTDLSNPDVQHGYLCNVHADIMEKSGIKGGSKSVLGGTYTYHHYLQDRAQDSGWGCAYRSLQTIISWFKHQGYIYSPDVEPKPAGEDKTSVLRATLRREARVPTHEEIQTVLVDVGDKQANFIGSQKWIGSQEVCYVLSHLYGIESKFISVNAGTELVYKARDLGQHFATQSTPVMIGGGVLAHTIIGIDFNEKNGDVGYLILDPHYTGSEDLATITKKGWCGWKKNTFWDAHSFYNLCLPQRPAGI